ncbi:hypothetical protein BJF92_12460 [Rhizobium rhizosphaerae]|uniref:M23ase beta-sheet core domain-containing protein n=1 Tax=Xaviernesmea rhizosphaerae TaxID=1672749 RepID=A0A1Q9ANB6_9HYPH|nr:M23 family metallopeptidase [Xaviernesmea rhizosphaerae]OLP56873.1 hypothetical protein BJF92_12460 [Xaviernesmea rhizosphaerae]
MTDTSSSRVFGQRKEPWLLILARGEKVRHVTLKPWMTATAIGLSMLTCVGFLGATAYLMLRDDLIGGTMARQARMQHDYEDRIAALRAQVDRVASRQLLDQQVVEQKVEKLLEQQSAISSRNGRIGSLVERAEDSGLDVRADEAPALDGQEEPAMPAYAPRDKHASAQGIRAIEAMIGLKTPADKTLADRPAEPPRDEPSRTGPLRAFARLAAPAESLSDRADRLFSKVTISLKQIERQQRAQIDTLTADAVKTADAIQSIATRVGVPLDMANSPTAGDEDAVGGPYIEPQAPDGFDRSLVALDGALSRLESARMQARRLPVSNPAPGSQITSPFGNRPDPFLGRLALHSGIDFRIGVGTAVHATAPGTVITAGFNGSYGYLVEIDHGNGVATRYAHMSEIAVHNGQKVTAGTTLGFSGNTGRSTGPHLHYEVRLDGRPVDPMRFLMAGRTLAPYLN